jgi:hypothetical protein
MEVDQFNTAKAQSLGEGNSAGQGDSMSAKSTITIAQTVV